MTTLSPVPARASVRDLLADLLGRDVTVAPAAPQTLDEGRTALAAVYVDDAGAPAAVAVCDLPLAHGAGAAIGAVPPAAAAAELASGQLGEETRESFHEVVNIFAKLLNSPATRHVRLDTCYELPGHVPAAAAMTIVTPIGRVDYEVSIDGYGGGTLTVLVA